MTNKVYFVYAEFDAWEKDLMYVFSNKEAAEAYADRRNKDEEDAEAEDEEYHRWYTYYVREIDLHDRDPEDTKQEA